MKILHIIETLGVGGAEKAVVQLVNGIPEFEHIVVILSEPATLKEKLQHAECINLNAGSWSKKLRAIRKLREIIRREGVDIVHGQLFHSTLLGRLASRNRVPFIFTLQSMLGEDLFRKNFISRAIERITYSGKNYIIAVSNEALNDYSKYIPVNRRRASVIYNSIEEKFFRTHFRPFSGNERVRLIAVGNLKPLKNFDYILEALRPLPQGVFELDIYGEGPDREFLQGKIDKYKLPVILMGNVNDLEQRIPTYDIYLHCSKYEGSSLAVFEAMATGLPLIVSDIPVLRENTGGFATYVNLKNPGDLSEKLLAAYEGRHDLNENGRKGFEWVKTVAHPSVVMGATKEFYKSVLEDKLKTTDKK